jgi:hypothetical protein
MCNADTMLLVEDPWVRYLEMKDGSPVDGGASCFSEVRPFMPQMSQPGTPRKDFA